MDSIKATQYLLLSSRKEHKDMTGQEQCCLPQPLVYQTFQAGRQKHVPMYLIQLCC